MRFQAKHIEDLKGGDRVEINGKVYIRMVDDPLMHVEAYVIDPDTGRWLHWSQLAKGSEMVTLRNA